MPLFPFEVGNATSATKRGWNNRQQLVYTLNYLYSKIKKVSHKLCQTKEYFVEIQKMINKNTINSIYSQSKSVGLCQIMQTARLKV